MPITPPNQGPRLKQIEKIRNDETISNSSDLLGIDSLNETNWLDIRVEDIVVPSMAGGRLTVGSTSTTPGDPVTGVTGSGTSSNLFYVPYSHGLITLYDGSKWNYHQLPPYIRSGLPAGTVNGGAIAGDENVDVYIYDNAGTLTFEFAKWQTHIIGGVRDPLFTIAKLNGVWVGSWDSARRYVGTIRTAAIPLVGIMDTSNDSRYLGVWNVQNQVLHNLTQNVVIGSNLFCNGCQVTPIAVWTDWGITASPDDDIPIKVVCGLPTPIKCYFNYTAINLAAPFGGQGGWICQLIPNYKSSCDQQVYMDTTYNNSVGFAFASLLFGSNLDRPDPANGQERQVNHGRVWAGTVFSDGYHELTPRYQVKDVIIPGGAPCQVILDSGYVIFSGSYKLEMWR